MAYVQFDTQAHILSAAQTIGATPAIDDGTPAVAVWFGFQSPSSVVTPSEGADGTWLFSTFYWGQAALDWWTAQGFTGYLGSGLEDCPAGWTPKQTPLP